MEHIAANVATSHVRRVISGGCEYLVAPISMIVPGVLNGNMGALYYPHDEVSKSPTIWNDIPLTAYHPHDHMGNYVTADSPGVVDRQGIGLLKNAHIKGRKLRGQGWFDVDKLGRVEPRILDALRNGKQIEVSTGLFTENQPAPEGSQFNGHPYKYIARNYKPDHLAILPDQVGACSIKDGCGVLVNTEHVYIAMNQQYASHVDVHSPTWFMDLLVVNAGNAEQERDEKGRWTSHGMSASQIGEMSHSQLKVTAGLLLKRGKEAKAMSEGELRAKMTPEVKASVTPTSTQTKLITPTPTTTTTPSAAKPKTDVPEHVQAAATPLSKEDHLKAVKELAAARGEADLKGMGDLRKDPMPPKDVVAKAMPVIEKYVEGQQRKTTVAAPIDQIYGALEREGIKIPPSQFRALLLSLKDHPHLELHTHNKSVYDLERPDLSPITRGAQMGYFVKTKKDLLHNRYTVNPAVSEAQRKYLNATFGHDWVKEHGFDNHGSLPDKVSDNKSDKDGEEMATNILTRFVDWLTHNAGINQLRHLEKGTYLPKGAGTGKGEVHSAAVGGSQHRDGHVQAPEDDSATDDDDDERPSANTNTDGVPETPIVPLATTPPPIKPKKLVAVKAGSAEERTEVQQVMPTQTKSPTTTNAFGPGGFIDSSSDPHTASKQAAAASVQTEHPEGMKKGLSALDASGDDNPNKAAKQHGQAAEAHECAATDCRKGGDQSGADDHDMAAALHRKAASMHAATRNTMNNTNNEKSLEGASAAERGAAFSHMADQDGPTGKAGKASSAAHAAETKAGSWANSATKAAHGKAAKLHKEAAEHHKDEGNTEQAQTHMQAAKYHAKRSGSTNNMNREQILERLTANCGCSEDKVALNALSTDTLQGIWNAKAEGSFADTSGSGGTEQAGGEEDDDDADDIFEDKVKIKKKGLSTNQWLAGAPVEVQSVVRNAMEVERSIKSKMIAQLTTNAAEKSELMKLPLHEVKLQLRRAQAYAANHGANVHNTPQVDPLYMGVGGVVSNVSGGEETDFKSNFLPLPIMNFSDKESDAG